VFAPFAYYEQQSFLFFWPIRSTVTKNYCCSLKANRATTRSHTSHNEQQGFFSVVPLRGTADTVMIESAEDCTFFFWIQTNTLDVYNASHAITEAMRFYIMCILYNTTSMSNNIEYNRKNTTVYFYNLVSQAIFVDLLSCLLIWSLYQATINRFRFFLAFFFQKLSYPIMRIIWRIHIISWGLKIVFLI